MGYLLDKYNNKFMYQPYLNRPTVFIFFKFNTKGSLYLKRSLFKTDGDIN
ncbi:hypothetical protein ATE84_1418 [Aquimarina sp. MAR_2010_214]|nr:hypothetical protein ATE84_1418 [Aquimarina sp. MAR_2010_214]